LLTDLIVFLCSCFAFSQYSLEIQKPNTIALKAADLWNVVLQNSGNNSIKIYIIGTITEKSRGKLYEIRSGEFGLNRGISIYNTKNYADLAGEKVIHSDKLFEEHIVRTNTLPNGIYTFCGIMYNAANNQMLANDCITFTINQVTPPTLIFPNNGISICENQPLFVWEKYRGAINNNNLSYKIKIVEILKSQKANSAIQTNPCFYCEDFISNPQHQISFKSIPFQDGKTYAWYIGVLDGKKEIARSEIWMFYWKKCNDTKDDLPQDDEVEENVESEIPNLPKTGISYYYMSKTQNDDIVAVTDTSLHIRMINYELRQDMDAMIVDGQQKPILTKNLVLNKGHNYFSFGIKNLNLLPMKTYTLRLATQKGLWYHLSFFTIN